MTNAEQNNQTVSQRTKISEWLGLNIGYDEIEIFESLGYHSKDELAKVIVKYSPHQRTERRER